MIPAATASLLLVLQISWAAAQSGSGAFPPPGCPTSCGDVSVPYPFGIGARCSLPGFDLICDQSTRLLLGDGGTLQVVEISLANSTVRVVDTSGAVNITTYGTPDGNGTWGGGLGSGTGSTFVVSEERNQLVVTGCNVQATLLVGDSSMVITGCSSFCSSFSEPVVSIPSDGKGACSGIGCCETPIPIGRPNYTVELKHLDPNRDVYKLPLAVRIAERGWFDGVAAMMVNESDETTASRLLTPVPVVLAWAVPATPGRPPGYDIRKLCPTDTANSACRSSHSLCQVVFDGYRSGYVCRCEDGHEGNPYIPHGCQDIDECTIPGKCFGVCTNTAGGYECRCPRGSHGNPNISDGCVKSTLEVLKSRQKAALRSSSRRPQR